MTGSKQKRNYQSEANKIALAVARKRKWADPEFVAMMRATGPANAKKLAQRIANGELPKLKATRLKALALGRKTNWANPEYRAKMSKKSTETMAKTNRRRAAGEFPEWDKKHREGTSIRTKAMWASGFMSEVSHRKYGIFRSRTEVRFAEMLDKLALDYDYEPIRFEIDLQGKKATYAPDFYIFLLDLWVEVKGYWRDEDARNRVNAFMTGHSYRNYVVTDYSENIILASNPKWLGLWFPILTKHLKEIRQW